MDAISIGVAVADDAALGVLEAAVRSSANVVPHRIQPGDRPSPGVSAIIIDAPTESREGLIRRLRDHTDVPILVEVPITLWNAASLRSLTSEILSNTYLYNPLNYQLPLQRVRADLVDGNETIESIFASYRFKEPADMTHAIPQLLDYVCGIVDAPVVRASSMHRVDPVVWLTTLRFSNEIVAQLEIGAHLPPELPTSVELILECFCRERVFHCRPDRQVVDVDGSTRLRHDWSPQPAARAVGEFIEAVRLGQTPHHPAHRSTDVLQTWSHILAS